ncbi:MAG TPA: malto-oligosyltrehalose trehalohydrolase [Candidatus Binatia bacterium]
MKRAGGFTSDKRLTEKQDIPIDDQAIGAVYLGNHNCRFRVWAPTLEKMSVRLVEGDRIVPLIKGTRGYHDAIVKNVGDGARYFYQLAPDKKRPDPASRFQPEGVHGPSQVVDSNFRWDEKGWRGIALKDYVIYELHVGRFTASGTFDALIPYLEYLFQLGVTAIELMPVAQFPGGRNWGYDGVLPFAVQNSYGGPQAMKRFINACHRRGLAVILDVVYNHLGPEGNYLADFGPYFTDRYKTPWGPALNFDGPFSDEVREFFIQNALYWITEFHLDALRLDAVHAILDHSPVAFVDELSREVHQAVARLERQAYLIAESADNDGRLIRARELGGYGLDAVWNDDFHHCLRTLLTGERNGYYQDYGEFPQFVKAYREGFAYSGEYSRFRRRRHGSVARDIPANRFVVFSQNHDQVGNRMQGDRLGHAVSFVELKLAAGLVILSPFIPLLFMGEEYAEPAPFPYFISHSDKELIEAVRRGRREEFASFDWQGEIPDPQDAKTFLRAELNHELRNADEHLVMLKFYRELIRLRKTVAALDPVDENQMKVASFEKEQVMVVQRSHGAALALLVANLSAVPAAVTLSVPDGRWRSVVDSADETWRGKGSLLPREFRAADEKPLNVTARSFALFVHEEAP